MAETIQLRYCAMKSQLCSPDTDNFLDSSSAKLLLNDMREKNMNLSTELERTKQKLLEKEGDIQYLREEKRELAIRLQNQAEISGQSSQVPFGEREELIRQLETLKRTIAQLKFDMHSMVDDKSELFQEMEAYKAKCHNLSEELKRTTKGDSMDSANEIDKLLAENKKLKSRMTNIEKDLEMSREIIIKYKVSVAASQLCK